MSSFGRIDVIVLALMLVYLFAVGIHVFYRYYSARRVRRIENGNSGIKKLAAVVNIKTGSLKSIALIAPCLGLAGTCLGILSAFWDAGIEKHATLPIIATRIALALIPTAVAIPVAVLAICSYNYLSRRMDLFQGEVTEEGQERGRHFRRTPRFPPAERFAELPAFGLLGALPAFGLLTALGLTVFIKVYMPFPPLPTPRGFYVELAATRCEFSGHDRFIVLHITDTSKLFLNLEQEDWNNLANRLSQIYSMREDRTLYLLADTDVPFQTVARVLDAAVESDVKVRLVTPKALRACETVVTLR
jgi:biopolymer transport protein ExbD